MDETDRLRRRARVLTVAATVLWVAVVVGFGWLTVALDSATNASDDDRALLMAQFMTGFAAVVALLPTLLWLTVAVAAWRGRRWAAPVGVAAAVIGGACSAQTSAFVFADWGGYLYGFLLLLNGLGVAAVISMYATRAPLPTSSVPRSG